MAQDGREVGFIKLYRSLESSPDFIGLRADQCWVAVRILQLANFKPGLHRFRGQAIEVGRGELAHTLETIAERSNSTIKVVRTTVARLLRSGFLGSRTGTVAGTAYRVLIVNNYDQFQGDQDDTGTVAGTAAGSERAATGHGPGSDRALREEGEEGKKEKKEALRRPAPVLLQAQCPSLASLLQRAADAGLDVDPGRTTPQWDEAEDLSRKHGADAVLACWMACAARRSSPGPMPLAYALHAMREIGRPASPGYRLPYRNPLDDNRVDDRQEAARAWAAANGVSR